MASKETGPTGLSIVRTKCPGGMTSPAPWYAAYSYGGIEGVHALADFMLSAYPPNKEGGGFYGSPQVANAVLLITVAAPKVSVPRLIQAVRSFGTPKQLADAAGQYRDGKGAGRDAFTIVKRYNSSSNGMDELPYGVRKLALKASDLAAARKRLGGLGEDEETIWPWTDPTSNYSVKITQARAGNMRNAECNRTPADRRAFLKGQGDWCKALEGVLDVVEFENELLIVDGGGRHYKKLVMDGDGEYVFDIRLHAGITTKQAVLALFERLNSTRRAVRPVEMFLGGVQAGSSVETDIQKALGEHEVTTDDDNE
jgi:hypothetical protein